MRVLVLTPRFLWPLISGAEIRNFNLMRETARHHDVYLLSFLQDPDDRQYFDALAPYCKKIVGVDHERPGWRRLVHATRSLISGEPFILHEYYTRAMAEAVTRVIADHKIDVVHAHCPHMTQYVRHKNGSAFVYDTHNIYYVLWDRFSSVQKNPLVRRYAALQRDQFADWERNIVTKVEKIVALSDNDRREYLKIAPEADIVTVPNGADVEFFRPGDGPVEDDSIIYFANFGWPPQADAAVHFAESIFPSVCRDRPNATLYLVGKTPPESVTALASDRVIVTGFVDDIRPYIARAAVVVMPLRVGSGTKHRIFQALSMEKALVTTSTGAEGIDLEHGVTALIEDGDDEFARAVVRLLEDADLRASLGRSGRRLILDRYDWRSIYSRLDTTFEDALRKRR